jgi:hypothetical protein
MKAAKFHSNQERRADDGSAPFLPSLPSSIFLPSLPYSDRPHLATSAFAPGADMTRPSGDFRFVP